MKITEIRAKRIKGNNRLKGIAAITIDECFVIHELRIIDGKNGLFVAMPSRRMPNGEYKDVAHPINTETRSMIEKEVLEAYHALPELEEDETEELEEENEEENEETTEDTDE
ncbi:MAG: septation regulator SpoVG [Candidatus Izemoplasmatales bacterium]